VIELNGLKYAICNNCIEPYIDKIATAAFRSLHEAGKGFGPDFGDRGNLYDLVVVLISASVVHEWLHDEAGLDEASVRFATEQVIGALSDSGLSRPTCPVA
jgi:hypothetical protein